MKKRKFITMKTMKSKRRSEILIKTIDKFSDENPGMRENIHKSTINICIKEKVSPEQVPSVLFSFSLLLSLS